MTDVGTVNFEQDELDIDQELTEQKPTIAKSKSMSAFVPKVQNMDDYLIKHYKAYIIQELNQRLVDGKIEEIIGVPVKSERILPGECCFQRFNYWRINHCDLWVDIDLRLELKILTDAGIDTDFYWFYVELWFSFADDEEECCFDCIGKLSDKPEHEENWKLDKYLVPVLRRDEIDKYSEAMWEDYLPEAAKDGKLRRPRDFRAALLYLREAIFPHLPGTPSKGSGYSAPSARLRPES